MDAFSTSGLAIYTDCFHNRTRRDSSRGASVKINRTFPRVELVRLVFAFRFVSSSARADHCRVSAAPEPFGGQSPAISVEATMRTSPSLAPVVCALLLTACSTRSVPGDSNHPRKKEKSVLVALFCLRFLTGRFPLDGESIGKDIVSWDSVPDGSYPPTTKIFALK